MTFDERVAVHRVGGSGVGVMRLGLRVEGKPFSKLVITVQLRPSFAGVKLV